MYSICTLHAHHIYSVFTLYVEYMHSICTVYAQINICSTGWLYVLSCPWALQCARNVPVNTDVLCDNPVVRGVTINGTLCTSKHMTPGYCRLTVRREHNMLVSSVQVWYFVCRYLRLVCSIVALSIVFVMGYRATELVDRGEDEGWGTVCTAC
jgi:hypothetical protein